MRLKTILFVIHGDETVRIFIYTSKYTGESFLQFDYTIFFPHVSIAVQKNIRREKGMKKEKKKGTGEPFL